MVSIATRILALLWLLLVARRHALHLEDDTPFDTDTIASGSTFCVDSPFGEYVCEDDPRKIRQKVDGAPYIREMHMGVVQRIDGNEEEKKGIKEVLRLMNKYWYEEVLSISAYTKSVRTACKNKNELCAFWSAIGECESNRVFMLSNCAASCRFCLLLNTNLPSW